MNEVLRLPRRLAIALLHAAQNAAPERVGGLVGANAAGPSSFLPQVNLAVDPTQQLGFDIAAAQTNARMLGVRGETLWAVYGSHPTRAGEPDRAELEASPFPEALYLAISLDIKGVLQLRVWRLVEGQPVESVIALLD